MLQAHAEHEDETTSEAALRSGAVRPGCCRQRGASGNYRGSGCMMEGAESCGFEAAILRPVRRSGQTRRGAGSAGTSDLP